MKDFEIHDADETALDDAKPVATVLVGAQHRLAGPVGPVHAVDEK